MSGMSSSSEPTPRRAMKKLHCYFFTDDELHAEYAWAWVLHNLVPFTDKVLGIAGAMDQRPIAALDWQIRLPLSLAVAANPTSKPLLAVAHAANVAFWFARMPAVWDYMCWVALTEVVYVVAVLRGADDVLRRRRGHDRGDVALLRRRARAVRVHRWDFLAHDARVAALGEAIERLLDLHGRGSIRAMISGWSSKASEAELKGVEVCRD